MATASSIRLYLCFPAIMIYQPQTCVPYPRTIAAHSLSLAALPPCATGTGAGALSGLVSMSEVRVQRLSPWRVPGMLLVLGPRRRRIMATEPCITMCRLNIHRIHGVPGLRHLQNLSTSSHDFPPTSVLAVRGTVVSTSYLRAVPRDCGEYRSSLIITVFVYTQKPVAVQRF